MSRFHETMPRVACKQRIPVGVAIGLSFLMAPAAQSDQPAMPLGASPMPAHVELRFCYYAGLAYSQGATIAVEAPIRREVVTDRARKVLRCVSESASGGRHHWQEVNPDAGDPFRD